MRRKLFKLFLVFFVPSVVYVTFNQISDGFFASRDKDAHDIEKRSQYRSLYVGDDDPVKVLMLPENDDTKNTEESQDQFQEPLPGELVCGKKRKRAVQLSDTKFDSYPDIIEVPLPLNGKAKEPQGVKVSVSRQNPSRPLGCCPPGDVNGIIYRTGSACCRDLIYNTSSDFCCITKYQVLPLDNENINFCYPVDKDPYCRVRDLKMEQKKPMKYKCEYNTYNDPTSCKFKCPQGTRSKNDINKVSCTPPNGVWDKKPICCEGCPKNTEMDLWFVIEVSRSMGIGSFNNLKRFLKDALSYLPIAKNRVRVGCTVFNEEVHQEEGGWDLVQHDSYKSLMKVIDDIPFQGKGSNIGEALAWAANNAFTVKSGFRDNVDHHVVAIVSGKPSDSFFDGARELKTIANVLAIAVGKDVSEEDLLTIGSSPNLVHRVENYSQLSSIKTVLYRRVCGENCIIDK